MKIEEYGFLSDTETSALVGRDGSMDWLCMPRFDSPACFAKLLGTEDNGFWKIAPKHKRKCTRRQYRDGSLILETEFETPTGTIRLIDTMPLRDQRPDVVRVVEGVSGHVAMEMKIAIRFDYGEVVPWVEKFDGGIVAKAGPDALILRSDVKLRGENFATVADFTVKKGDRVAFVLTWFPSHQDPPKPIKSEHSIARTEKYWREWSGRYKGSHPWAAAVKRSLLVLKGLTFAPTGGIVAAPTTSLPEFLGGNRNWDYRFCWLRDATLTLFALIGSGYTEEACAWRDWLLRAVAGNPDQTQILYGVGGERRLQEFELSHLIGYENSRPVRVGNAASTQFQLDVYGEVIGALFAAREAGLERSDPSLSLEQHLVEFVARHWQDKDEGIWEVRGGRRHFTHSKVMAWVALDRAIRSRTRLGGTSELKRWKTLRNRIHREVCEKGFNKKRGAFTQSYDCDRLDASLLMIPHAGFLPATDPRMRGTIEAIQRELVVDGFVLRYDRKQSAAVDGLVPGEGTFLPCTFWLADCLCLLGRQDEAVATYERVLAIRNDLGLLAEEYDPRSKRMLGNFPQAFSHVGLINTASILTDTHPSSVPARCEHK